MLVPLNSKQFPNLFTQIDEEDLHIIGCRKMTVIISHSGYRYARLKKKGKNILLSRLIMNPPEGMVVDHINHDTLDNRRSNLRVCTRQQNRWNQKIQAGTSIYKGVYKIADHKKSKRWCATITTNGIAHRLGKFHTEEEAARAYDSKAKLLQGEFAVLNFPNE